MPSPARSLGGRLARPSLLRLAALAALLAFAPALSAATVDFGDVNLSTPPAVSYSGPGGGVYHDAGAFVSGGVGFNGQNFGFSWAGFAYSTTSDTTTGSFTNQYSAYALGGNSGAYAVGYFDAFNNIAPTISFGSGVAPVSVDLTNVAYAALDMANGSGFSKKFGGASGDDADFFKVVITGRDAGDTITGTVEFFLADFTFDNNSLDHIVDEWTTVDLTGLGVNVSTIELSFVSSDVGALGINTPTYVALDNLVYTSAIPEPSACAALAGAGLLGFATLRRRRRSSAAALA